MYFVQNDIHESSFCKDYFKIEISRLNRIINNLDAFIFTILT